MMKKVITLFLFVALFNSNVSLSQDVATLLTSEHRSGSMSFPNHYLGTDGEHSYFLYNSTTFTCFIVSDKKGNCEEYNRLVTEVNGKSDKFPRANYLFFNHKAFIVYWANTGSNGKSLYVTEWPKDGKLIPENSIKLDEGKFDYDIEFAFNHDSTEFLIANDVFNTSFKKIKEGHFEFNLGKGEYVRNRLYDDNKLIFICHNTNDVVHATKYSVVVCDYSNGSAKKISIPTDKAIVINYYLNLNSYTAIYNPNNIKYKNGILYMFGYIPKSISYAVGNASPTIIGLVFLKIDVSTGICKTKYLSGTGTDAHYGQAFVTMGIKVNDDNSVIVYNNYGTYGYNSQIFKNKDTLECIKFDENMNLVFRKKTAALRKCDSTPEQGGFYFDGKKTNSYLYT